MKLLDHLEEYLIALLMATATLITFVAVVHRYMSGFAIPLVQDYLISLNTSWAQELTIYLFVWMAKFGAAYGVRSGIHVGVDVFVVFVVVVVVVESVRNKMIRRHLVKILPM